MVGQPGYTGAGAGSPQSEAVAALLQNMRSVVEPESPAFADIRVVSDYYSVARFVTCFLDR